MVAINAFTIAAIVAALIALFAIFIYNGLVSLRNQVRNSFAQIDVQLKRRNDLIPNLVETVKGYMKHEKTVLENITKARSAILEAKTMGEKSKASNMLSQTFLQLQEENTGTESKIAYARQYYNDIVDALNTKIETFPNNTFSKLFNFNREEQFAATENERKAIKVEF